ncbi:MAG: hypothetical protein PHI91_00370 [Candidatus Pacebacteria bacterium]|nr:hypothetical protein [Candidatus Paceibacterota bacterium]MDD2756994.1 hypothetical protein [Candidatus Paceibacterota bacterium]MDD3283504.1 hypothetical protein [Candidatus Paceibacterota bacterium]MDD3969640.1 hypothetical protein [Candidatus Paceibacterota bacterium]MDD4738020.1 hypothetical protein [Candidatus Paceibacterota bacterium]
MENKEKIPESNFENIERKEVSPSSSFEKPQESKVEKSIDEIVEKNFDISEVIEKTSADEGISQEQKDVMIKIKESQGASIGKISSIINKIKKKFSPHGVDKYHDELTKRKDDQ